MSRTKVTLVMASGKELEFDCADAKVTSSRIDNTLNGLTMTDVRGRDFLFIRLAHVDVVLYEKED